MSTTTLFSASVRKGQHMHCLVSESLSLNEALGMCRAKGIRVVSYAKGDGRWVFKTMVPASFAEVES